MRFRQTTSRAVLIIALLVMATIISFPNKLEASSTTYKVYNLKANNKRIDFGSELLETTNFSAALKEMQKYKDGVVTSDKSPSPLKIVAASRGQAQSYPYRKGKDLAGVTLNIYSNTGLTSAHTYISAHYMMYVYGYTEAGGRILADVEIQGGRGYVEVNKTDIIPMIYIENGIGIEIGGNEDYYSTKEQAYTIVPKQESYTIRKGDKYNEIVISVPRSSPKLDGFSYAYAIGPSFLNVGTTYYSPDGIRFYTDRDLKNKVGGDFYAYYQWLPIRSMTNHQPEAFDKFLKHVKKENSTMLGETHHFIEQGLKYGMNPVFIFHQANLESGYGTSKYADKRYNNLFGWGAVDSDPDKAKKYANIGEGIAVHMSTQIAGYTSVTDWRHYGASFGNKGAGITVKYASDPYYGIKVSSIYYAMDKLNGYKDYNAYQLSTLKNYTSYSVKKDKTGSGEWYKTKGNQKDQVFINLGKEANRIKTTLWMPNYEGKSYSGYFPLNLYKEFGYIENTGINNITQYGSVGKLPEQPRGWNPPKKELNHSQPMKAQTTSSVNFRESFTTDSKIITLLPKGTSLVVETTNIGWARTSYNGRTGYVSMDFLKIDESSKPEEPKDPEKLEFNLGDILGTEIKDNIMSGIKLNTSLSEVENIILKTDSKAIVTLYNKSNKKKNKSDPIVTGDKLKVTQGSGKAVEYEIAIIGDSNGDGKINSSDYIRMANHILGRNKLSGPELRALDINGNGIINSADYVA